VKAMMEKCTKYIDKNSIKTLKKYLNSELNETLTIDNLIDSDGFSILHLAAFKNKTDIVNDLVAMGKL
jgi:ankyrin repeat protein